MDDLRTVEGWLEDARRQVLVIMDCDMADEETPENSLCEDCYDRLIGYPIDQYGTPPETSVHRLLSKSLQALGKILLETK